MTFESLYPVFFNKINKGEKNNEEHGKRYW